MRYNGHGSAAIFFVRLLKNIGKTVARCHADRIFAVFSFPRSNVAFYFLEQCISLREISAVKINMKYGIFRPLFFQGVNSKTLEQFFLSLEVGLQRGNQQALAKTARTAQKINSSFRHKIVKLFCLVHIDISVFSYLFETLYSNWVLRNRCR